MLKRKWKKNLIYKKYVILSFLNLSKQNNKIIIIIHVWFCKTARHGKYMNYLEIHSLFVYMIYAYRYSLKVLETFNYIRYISLHNITRYSGRFAPLFCGDLYWQDFLSPHFFPGKFIHFYQNKNLQWGRVSCHKKMGHIDSIYNTLSFLNFPPFLNF